MMVMTLMKMMDSCTECTDQGWPSGCLWAACSPQCHFMWPAVKCLECGWYVCLGVCWV